MWPRTTIMSVPGRRPPGVRSAELVLAEEVQQAGQDPRAGRDLGVGQVAADLAEEGLTGLLSEDCDAAGARR